MNRLRATLNSTQQPCDYAKLATQVGKPHGPAVVNRRGYNICQRCADAMSAAERQEDELYKALQRQYVIDQQSRELQRRCFL